MPAARKDDRLDKTPEELRLDDPFAGIEQLDPFSQEDIKRPVEQALVTGTDADRMAPAVPPINETVVPKQEPAAPPAEKEPMQVRIEPQTPIKATPVPTAQPATKGPTVLSPAVPTQPAQPAQQRTAPAQPQEPPVARMFKSYLESMPSLRKAWQYADAKTRQAIVDKFLNYDINRRLSALRKDPKFRKLKATDRSRIERNLFRRYKAQGALQLYGLTVDTPVNSIDIAPLQVLREQTRPKAGGKAGGKGEARPAATIPLEADEIMARLRGDLQRSQRLQNFWTRATVNEQESFLKKYVNGKIIAPALDRLRKTDAYKQLKPKQRTAVEKRLKERLQAEADKAFLGLPGSMVDEIVADGTKVDRVGNMSRKTDDPNWFSAMFNSFAQGAKQGFTDTVVGMGDVAGLAAQGAADNAVVNWARNASNDAKDAFAKGMPEEERKKYADMSAKLAAGDWLGAAGVLFTSPELLTYYTANTIGWVVGSGGVYGAGRAAAAKGLAITAAKVSGRASRLAKAAQGAAASKAAKVGAPYAGFVSGAAGQAGEDAYQQMKAMKPEQLRASPAWLKMERALAATLGRQPTPQEVHEGLARAARGTAAAIGAGASAASFLLYGGIPEAVLAKSINQLGLKGALSSLPGAGAGVVKGAAKGALGEAKQEFIESGGGAAGVAYATGKSPEEILQQGAAQGAFGATVGAAIGAGIGAAAGRGGAADTGPFDPDTPLDTQDPDIAEARRNAQAANASIVKAAAEMAGMKAPEVDAIVPRMTETGDVTISTPDGKPILERRNGQWIYRGVPVDLAEHPDAVAIASTAELMLDVEPGTLVDRKTFDKAQQVLQATEEAQQATQPTDVDAEEKAAAPDEKADAELSGVPQEEADVEGGPSVTEEDLGDMSVDMQRDVVFGYMKSLMASGEPFNLALKSAKNTFGAKMVRNALSPLFKQGMTLEQVQNEIDATDLGVLSSALKQKYGLEGDIRHTSIVQRALADTGLAEGVIVVNDASEMPGMPPNVPVATFKSNGGKSTFTVLNAAAFKPKSARRLKYDIKVALLGHELTRTWLQDNTQAKLFAAAVDLMVQRGVGISYMSGGKRPRSIDVTPTQAQRMLSVTEDGEYKVKTTRSADEINKWFATKLRNGDPDALYALKRVLKEAGIRQVDRMSIQQLYRVLLEAEAIPATDAGVLMATPPKRRAASKEPGPVDPPNNRKTPAMKAAEKGGDATVVSNAINTSGALLQTLKAMDGMYKVTVLRGIAEKMPDDAPMKQPLTRLADALRARQSKTSLYISQAQELLHMADVKAQELAKRAGYEDVTTFKNEYMVYRLARHAKERNALMYILTTPLRDKEAVKERQVLMDKLARGEVGAETVWGRLRELAEEYGTMHPDTVFAGMTNAEAEDVIRWAKKTGKAETFEQLDPFFDDIANKVLRWREEAGTYAGPAKRAIEAYNWKYYTPLVDADKLSSAYQANDEVDVLDALIGGSKTRTRRPSKKKLAQGRINLEGVNWDSWHVELRNAALSAANADVARSALETIKAQGEDPEFTLGHATEIGKVKYVSEQQGSDMPGWKVPSTSERNPHVLAVYDPETESWQRIVVSDPEVAKYVRNDYEDDSFLNNWLVRKIGAGTRLLGRGYTTFRPSFWATSFIRDVIQDAVLLWSQKGLNPVKFTTRTVGKVMGLASKDSYLRTLAKFAAATPLQQEKLANDPQFLSRPGAKNIVERWRNGGWITFADYIAEGQMVEKTGTIKTLESAVPSLRAGLIKLRGIHPAMDKFIQAMEMPDAVMTALDNLHRQVLFDMLVEEGVSPADAASYSRRIMDFGRSSKWGRRLNAFYAFVQAGFTGIGTMIDNHIWADGVPPLKVERGPDGYHVVFDRAAALEKFNWKLASALMLMGASSVLASYMLLGEDDDGRPKADGIRPSSWMNYLITPFGTYGPNGDSPAPAKIPLQYGPSQLFFGLGAAAGLIMMGRDFKDIAYAYTNQLLKNVIPVGQPSVPAELTEGRPVSLVDMAKSFALTVTPTMLLPPTEVLMNRNVFGGKIHKELDYRLGREAHDLGYTGTPGVWGTAAEWVNDALSKIGIKPSLYPEDVELLVRDMMPVLGPMVAAGPRFWISFMERPERTKLEAVLSSSMVPFPGLVLDHRYKTYEVERRLRARYYQPAKDALKAAQALRPGPERQKALREVYTQYPFLRSVRNLDQKFGRRLQAMRDAIRAARQEGDSVKVEGLWLQYQEMQKLRTRKLVEIFKQYGIEP